MHQPGAIASEGNSGSVAGAVLVAIWKVHEVGPFAKWSDDVSSLRSPSSSSGTTEDPFTYAYDRQKAVDIVAPTGIPWHAEKGQGFAYVGLEWDIEARAVSLSEKKRQKFLFRVDNFYAHIKGGGAPGRSRLSSFSFIAAFHKYRNPNIELHPPPSLITDARWWACQLLVLGFTRSLVPYGDLLDLGISVDASAEWAPAIELPSELRDCFFHVLLVLL
ncbi:hypothetical protein H1R20_g4465, partial [Candolleomyces eurysporus]